MDTASLLFLICLLSGLTGMIVSIISKKERIPLVLSVFGMLISVSAVSAGIFVFVNNSVWQVNLWPVNTIGMMSLYCDKLSALFIALSGLIFFPVSLFSRDYIRKYLSRTNIKFFSVFYLAFLLSIIALTIAGDVFSFIIAWELMSVICYILVNAEYKSEEARHAGYLMLTIGEAGTLAITTALIIIAINAGTTDFATLGTTQIYMGLALRRAVFLLSFFGFATKIGIIPVNIWLPRAHPIAPANISAILSGLVLNLGIYGLIRINLHILPVNTPLMGVIMLIIGALSALTGILYATIDNDIKKILAHSSIENMGIIITAIGAGVTFLSTGHNVFASIAFIAAFYHMINHSVYKTLLFIGAGTINIHTNTRNIDILGGLLKRMPTTGFFILIGCLAISALPPFNGFVSEWLTLESLLRSVELSSLGIKMSFVAAGVLLALTAGLAVTCFIRMFAMTFLGIPRSERVNSASETTKTTLASMAILAFICLILGVMPTYIIPKIDSVTKNFTNANATQAIVPPFFSPYTGENKLPKDFVKDFHNLGAQIGAKAFPCRGLVVMHRGGKENPVVFAMSTSYMIIMLIIIFILTVLTVWFFVARHRKIKKKIRWDGGIRQLLPEMTYTASGFALPVKVVFESIFRPKLISRKETVSKHFKILIEREREDEYMLDRLILHPLDKLFHKIADILAYMHNGHSTAYAAYCLISLIIVFFLITATL